ncbi:MAG: uroporphyrinogen-III synthase [Oceanospirillaceae bacterium]|nr:uroporphyrinogen-III synthase [Oceanospirillaceae bacterium]
MKVLVTRPFAQAKAMVELLQHHGFEVQHLPCLAIKPVPCESEDGLQSKRLAMALSTFDHVIVISTNAAQHWLDLVQDYWPQWPVGVNWWGMGESTQALLVASGIEAARPTTGDTSEALLADLLPQIRMYDKVLIVRGHGGRETLSDALTAAGAKVDYAQCYQRKMPQPSALQLLEVDKFAPQAVILQSGETLENFDALLGGKPWCDKHRTVLVLPSVRVADQANALGYRVILTSSSASNQSMCDTLLKSM